MVIMHYDEREKSFFNGVSVETLIDSAEAIREIPIHEKFGYIIEDGIITGCEV